MTAKRRDTAEPGFDTKALTEKLNRLNYSDFKTKPGQEEVLMLYVQGHHISSVEYALSLSDEALKALIDETVQVGGD